MNTVTRIGLYTNGGQRPMTGPQRRRAAKRAGTDPYAIVYRDDGMGYGPAKQGMREVVELRTPAPGEEEPF